MRPKPRLPRPDRAATYAAVALAALSCRVGYETLPRASGGDAGAPQGGDLNGGGFGQNAGAGSGGETQAPGGAPHEAGAPAAAGDGGAAQDGPCQTTADCTCSAFVHAVALELGMLPPGAGRSTTVRRVGV